MPNTLITVVSDTARDPLVTPTHGVAMGTAIRTLDGVLPVEYLSPGDRVITRQGARKIGQIEVTTIRHARAILIGAHTVGDNEPEDPVIVAPAQPVYLRGWRASAMTGNAEAMIPAASLVDGAFIRAVVLEEVRLYTLTFARAEIIYAGGLEVACPPVHVTA